MLESEGYEERGDGPAQAVLRANAEQQAVRQAIETQEELRRIRQRVCVTLSAYEIGEELREESESNVETIKNAFVKDDAELEFLDDMSQLYLILSDPIAKRKYQQKVTIFVVGYENLCSHRSKLLAQLQEFFTQSTEDSNSFMIDIPELDFEEVGKNVRDALSKAQRTTERLANISKEVLKVFDIVNPKDHKKGKKKLEKALYQSQQDVMNLTEKLVGVQSDFEDAKNKLATLNKQVELKELDIERLKLQVNTNKAFEKECEDLRKALEAKEKQLQNYRLQMDEIELSLSQAENKYDYYVENCKKLKDENEKLSEEMEKKIKEQQQSIIEMRKELEVKYDKQVNELKENQEQQIDQLKQSHVEETKNLKEKIDMLRKSSARQSDSTNSTPASRDSSVTRYSSATTEYSQVSLWKSSAKVVKNITQLKASTTPRLDTASSQTSVNQEKDSGLDTSETLTLSMSNITTPQTTPKVMEEEGKQEQLVSAFSASLLNNTTENSTQTEDIIQDREVKSRNDLQQIEVELSKMPIDELPVKIDEYKNKFMEIQQQLEEEVVQWKIKFNAKAQGLNQMTLVYEKEIQEKEELMKQLSAAQEQQTLAEQETEEAVLQLEELRAEKEINAHVIEDLRPSVATKSTLTSASLSRHKEEVKDGLQSPAKQVLQESVAIQCPSAHDLHEPDMLSPQCSESHLLLADDVDIISIPATDSGFEGSGNVFLSRLPHESGETNEAMALQSAMVEKTEYIKRTTPVPPSPRVRSRLVRSALKDHGVVMETIKTYEMVTEFKVDIMCWLKQYGLENKCELLTEIPDVALDKTDGLDVLSKLPIIRDQIRQIFDALWQVSRENYSWRDDESDGVEFDDGCDERDFNKETNIMEYHPSLSLTKETAEEKSVTSESDSSPIEKNLRVRSVQTDKLLSHPSRTTPKGYTRLLHENNNVNESYNKLQQQLEEDIKTYKQQTSQNAVIMNEMQETINNLRWQLLEASCNVGNTKQPLVPSVMFTRLDAERNVTSMKRAVQNKRLSQTSFNNTVQQMNKYVNLPARRLAELVKRYTHHCSMKEVEENIYPSSMTSDHVYNLQERMEQLQRVRAGKWSEKMAEMSQIRSRLGDEITSTLNEIEESSGIFLIKPVYSYSSRPQAIGKSHHPIICKRRLENLKKSSDVTAELKNKKSLYPVENSNVRKFEQSSDRPVWISKESHVRGAASSYENIPTPRLLVMDVNRIMLNRNPVSDHIKPNVSDSLSISGVRQYVTVERPIGIMRTTQLNRDSDVVSPRHSFPPRHRSSSPSMSNYSPLPPISLPQVESHHYPSAMSAYTNQSASSLSLTSSDER